MWASDETLAEALEAVAVAYEKIAKDAAAKGDIITVHRAVRRMREADSRSRRIRSNGWVS